MFFPPHHGSKQLANPFQRPDGGECTPSGVHHDRPSTNDALLCPAGGSFRHFLWQVCKELQSSSLSLLLLCPSSAVNKNKVSIPVDGRGPSALSCWPHG